MRNGSKQLRKSGSQWLSQTWNNEKAQQAWTSQSIRILSKSWQPTICCNFIGKQQHATSLHSASLLRALGTSDQNVKPRGSSGLCCQAEAKKLTEARRSRNRIACSFPSNHNAAAMRCHKRSAGYDLFQPVQGFHFRACVMSLASHSIRSKWRSYWSLIPPQSWWQPRSVSFRDVWSSGSLCPKEKGNNSNSSPLSSWWHVAPHVFKGHRKVQEHQRKNSQNMHIIALYNHFMPAHQCARTHISYVCNYILYIYYIYTYTHNKYIYICVWKHNITNNKYIIYIVFFLRVRVRVRVRVLVNLLSGWTHATMRYVGGPMAVHTRWFPFSMAALAISLAIRSIWSHNVSHVYTCLSVTKRDAMWQWGVQWHALK